MTDEDLLMTLSTIDADLLTFLITPGEHLVTTHNDKTDDLR